ncbi:hypothetical protein B9Z19DRAFT_1121945 [Tuber borchii]|uniref:Uncharacterized protein n=1 Tax=Tuber borchii TaxID=42251 RepID=A0A2T7A1Q3_TUBBO|nr:hypothetical protein B9Z19DRAFT_1121945 [Tuber borchii]
MLRAIFSSPNAKESLSIALASGAAYWVAIANTKRICRAEEEFRADLRFIEFQDALTKSAGGEGLQLPRK